MRELTDEEIIALNHALENHKNGAGSIGLVGGVASFLQKPADELTPEDVRTAHDEATLSQYVTAYRELIIQQMRAVGEQLAQLPEAERTLLLQIPTLSPEKRAQIAAIVTEENSARVGEDSPLPACQDAK